LIPLCPAVRGHSDFMQVLNINVFETRPNMNDFERKTKL